MDFDNVYALAWDLTGDADFAESFAEDYGDSSYDPEDL